GVVGVGVGGVEALLGLLARLDALGERHLLGGGEQRDRADLLQVETDRVGAAATAVGGDRDPGGSRGAGRRTGRCGGHGFGRCGWDGLTHRFGLGGTVAVVGVVGFVEGVD